MYAIVEVGGKQYKVTAGDVLDVEKIDKSEKSKVKLDKVLLINNDKDILIGKPYLKEASVNCTVAKQFKGEKLIVYKYKRRKDYDVKKGHRQSLTKLTVNEISLGK